MARSRRRKRSRPSPGVDRKAPPAAAESAAPTRSTAARKLIWIGLVGVLLIAAGAYVYSSRQPSGADKASSSAQGPQRFMGAADAGYVDPSACAGCHREIYETYQKTGMGRSFHEADAAIFFEDFKDQNTYHHEASGRYYTMLERDGKYYQRRHELNSNGKESNVIEREIHYVVGSGNRARTYLHRGASGKLVDLPLGWYAADGGFWAMNPGFDQEKHKGFRREINFDCMFCHNGYPSMAPGEDAHGREPRFRGALPNGIDCQRCHGPGQAHIDAVAAGSTAEEVRAQVVNPARLSTEQQIELCMQCHLESTSRRLPYSVRRFDRGAFSYRPGEPLAEYILHFDHPQGAGYDDKFEIAHAAYRLRKSACFQQTQGLPAGQAMTCTTCHDPHDVRSGDQASEHYRSVCRSCHGPDFEKQVAAGRHTASKDCLGCHMPKRRTDDVVHVVMTDHHIQRHRPRRDLLSPLKEVHDTPETAYRGEVELYYPPQLPAGAERDLYLAVAQVAEESNLDKGTGQLAEAVSKYQPEEAEFYFKLGDAYWKKGESEQAIPLYETALQRQPDHFRARLNLSFALSKTGEVERAIRVLEEGLQVYSQNPKLLSNLGDFLLQAGAVSRAIQVLEQATRADPDLPDAFNNLANAYSVSGDESAAEESFRRAIRLQPDYDVAHNNLANLLMNKGETEEAERHYKRAIASNPEYAEAHYNYARLLMDQQRMQEAEALLRKTLRLDPSLAKAHNNLGGIVATRGDLPKAITHFEAAVEADPRLAEARMNLGAALLLEQRPQEAKPHLLAAVDIDPEYHQAHLNLGILHAEEGNASEARVHLRKAAESANAQIRKNAQEALAEIEKIVDPSGSPELGG